MGAGDGDRAPGRGDDVVTGLLHLRYDLPTALDESFAAWARRRDGEVLRIPGIRRVRRFERWSSPPAGVAGRAARFLVLHDLADPRSAAEERDHPGAGPPPGVTGAPVWPRLHCHEVRRRPAVSTRTLFPAGEWVLHLLAAGDRGAMDRWLREEAEGELLRVPGVLGLRWFEAEAGPHVVLCEGDGPLRPSPPPPTCELGPAVWSGYRLVSSRTAPGG